MNIKVTSAYQAQIEFDGSQLKALGPLSLLNRLQEYKSQFGANPIQWKFKEMQTNDDYLIHEFISLIQKKSPLIYTHEELCHCRMVTAEKVHQAIKQGCRTANDIARTTLAGTGCGSCRKDSELILNALVTAN